MKSDKKAKYGLFLNNKYAPGDVSFFKRQIRGTITVAVDGGVRFFLKNRLMPDIIIGDFDSAPPLSAKFLSTVETISYPAVKDKTDSQLALELALSRGAREIAIFGSFSRTEIDHTLGNIFLLELVNKFNRDRGKKVRATLLGPDYELALVENGAIAFHGHKDDFFSLVPLSANPVVTFSGLKYPSPKQPLRIGDTLSLRNRLAASRVHLRVRGKAIAVILRKK